jgi:hypothetical protein
VISWGTIISGAGLSAVAALLAVLALGRERRLPALGVVVISALTGPLAWNAVLHSAGSSDFFHDAPIPVFPVSWQDVGSGVWTLAVASVAQGFTQRSAGHATILALLTAMSALLVDIYLY